MKRKLLSVVLTLAMILSMSISVMAADFVDVSSGDWFYKPVRFVTGKNYFKGVSENEFDPNGSMTRGMFVTVLGRLANIDRSEYTRDKFPDVQAEDWYYTYVTWANETGITDGYPDGNFYPDEPVNREQIAVLLDRYLKNAQITLEKNPNALESYTDEQIVSEWAADGVKLMRETAVFTGDQYGYFQPQKNGTRAEIASVIMRLSWVMEGQVLDVPVPEPEPVETPEPIIVVPVVTPPPQISRAQQIMNGMSLKEKVYQMFMVTPEQLTGVAPVTVAGAKTKEALAKQPVGGMVYTRQNLISDYQLTQMTSTVKTYMNIAPFVAVEEESRNRTQLLPMLEIEDWSSMYEYRDAGAEKAYEIGASLGRDISKYGFNMNFAPVADVWSNAKNTIIGERAFSTSPEIAAKMVSAEVRGLQDNGVCAVLKHYPGYGDVTVNTSTSKISSKKNLEQLMQTELPPFKAGVQAGADFVMCAHINIDEVDPNYPASMSRIFVTDILRNTFGFNGVVISDMMNDDAVRKYYTSVEAAVNCINAGVDMILCPDTFTEAANGVVLAVQNGQISEERINQSVERILNVKLNRGIIR
ncbi:MAG: glycoside hydrolase family 3 N-terminal domain-containing protein [Clostridia bacterium]